MHRFPALRIFLFFSAVALLAVFLVPRKSILHAQSGCDATTLNASYGLNLTGTVYDNQGYSYLLASVGRMVTDGAGNLTGSQTLSFDGTIFKQTFTGTYTMNADCTGSMTLQMPSNGTLSADIVTVDNAKQINFVQTDAAYIFSGVLIKQNP